MVSTMEEENMEFCTRSNNDDYCTIVICLYVFKVTKGQLRELKKLLKSESHRWFQLGFQLKVSLDELKKIEKHSGTKTPDICFLEVLSVFLKRNDEEKKWKVQL